eukprot:CAMPEP_0114579668 /NCGR_PEP_ID=MMETSP0125-20121206/4005_1 /TAXON_ID=485358 ORGANISM="Aristerostoma sp., Strain ATCC 50986" /NCGR_SAMPLE_ID=MMETSP0125 /ASSEMBLY_ACC=CAM_ASM_000245 /LENGTH=35 /DNA_ID= /DNA_START= /DNA_END= /DNA_ORIENTATION=
MTGKKIPPKFLNLRHKLIKPEYKAKNEALNLDSDV